MWGWLKMLADSATTRGSDACTRIHDPHARQASGCTVGDLWRRYIDACGAAWAGSTVRDKWLTAAAMAEGLGADRPAGGITPALAMAWIRAEASRTTPASARKHARNAHAAWKWAVSAGLVAANPWACCPRGAVANRSVRIVPREPVRRLIAELERRECRDVALALALARFAALRVPSEARALTWDRVDLQTRQLRVISVKTLRSHPERVVPIDPDLHAVLSRHAEPRGRVLWTRLANYRATLARAAHAAGVTLWPRPMQACRSSCENDWRRLVGPSTAATWAGHSPEVAAKHYHAVSEDEFLRVTCPQSVAADDDLREVVRQAVREALSDAGAA